jgi:hypothetical protein
MFCTDMVYWICGYRTHAYGRLWSLYGTHTLLVCWLTSLLDERDQGEEPVLPHTSREILPFFWTLAFLTMSSLCGHCQLCQFHNTGSESSLNWQLTAPPMWAWYSHRPRTRVPSKQPWNSFLIRTRTLFYQCHQLPESWYTARSSASAPLGFGLKALWGWLWEEFCQEAQDCQHACKVGSWGP